MTRMAQQHNSKTHKLYGLYRVFVSAIILLFPHISLSATQADLSEYYFTGKFDDKDMGFEIGGVQVFTPRFFHIYDSKAYLSYEFNDFPFVEALDSGEYKLNTKDGFEIILNIDALSNIEITLGSNKEFKKEKLTSCGSAEFFFEYIRLIEGIKGRQGKYYKKYNILYNHDNSNYRDYSIAYLIELNNTTFFILANTHTYTSVLAGKRVFYIEDDETIILQNQSAPIQGKHLVFVDCVLKNLNSEEYNG